MLQVTQVRCKVPDAPLRAVALIRMSTAKQVSSPARQRDLFLQYCSRYQLQPAGEYEDLATSATHVKLEDRVGIMAMLAAAERSSSDVVRYEEQSRASRDPLETTPIQRHLGTLGIPIVEHGEDPRQAKVSAERELLATVRAALSRYEVRQLAARVKRALRLKLEQGKYQGGPLPAGLECDREREAFVWDEKSPDLPRRAYELFAETKLIAGTARQLNQKGFRRRRGSPLTHKSASSLLKQPAYTAAIATGMGRPGRPSCPRWSPVPWCRRLTGHGPASETDRNALLAPRGPSRACCGARPAAAGSRPTMTSTGTPVIAV